MGKSNKKAVAKVKPVKKSADKPKKTIKAVSKAKLASKAKPKASLHIAAKSKPVGKTKPAAKAAHMAAPKANVNVKSSLKKGAKISTVAVTAQMKKTSSAAATTGKTIALRSTGQQPNKSTAAGRLPKSGGQGINQTMKNEQAPETNAVRRGSKNAPPMRLSVNDNDMIATAKEHYGVKDLAGFKKLIIEQRAEASEEFDIISEQMMDTSGEFDADNQAYALHTAEQGTDAMEREKTFLHAQRTSDFIKKLDEALERIDRGTYGICVICGKLIEKERLAAVPITQKHVDCKNKTQAKKLSVEQVYRDIDDQPLD